ncbi:hypothetical protein PRK78_002301 [Emydomyces testavorans]|uniref:Uncharacterized protein n=1 Tax=Emydomyces testavorans TaxID=2070801 RepID=A0AAF0IHN5_9EURO|nr:hypothetical protein PRK78_002301 [Emydomyces testavorans]
MAQNASSMPTSFGYKLVDTDLLNAINEATQQALVRASAETSKNRNPFESEPNTKDSHFETVFDRLVDMRDEYNHTHGVVDYANQHAGEHYELSSNRFPEINIDNFDQFVHNHEVQSVTLLGHHDHQAIEKFNSKSVLYPTFTTPQDPNTPAPAAVTQGIAAEAQCIEVTTARNEDSRSQVVSVTVKGVSVRESTEAHWASNVTSCADGLNVEVAESSNIDPDAEVIDAQGEADTSIKLEFKSAAEANAYTPEEKTPPLIDPTIPRSQDEREAIVTELMEAMYSLADSKDNEGMIRPWKDGRFCYRRVEIACWNILEACIERHETGPLRILWESKDHKPDNVRTFGERISIILQILRRVEQNKGLNAKKGIVIKAGKDALDKEEKKTGKALLPPRKRHGRHKAATIDPNAHTGTPRPSKRQRRAPAKILARANIQAEVLGDMPTNAFGNIPCLNLHPEAVSRLSGNTLEHMQPNGVSVTHSSTPMKENPYMDNFAYANNGNVVMHSDEYGFDLSRTMAAFDPSAFGNPIFNPSQGTSPTVLDLRPRGLRGIQRERNQRLQCPRVGPHATSFPASNMPVHGIQEQSVQSSWFPTPETQAIGDSPDEGFGGDGFLPDADYQRQVQSDPHRLPHRPHPYGFQGFTDMRDSHNIGFGSPIHPLSANQPHSAPVSHGYARNRADEPVIDELNSGGFPSPNERLHR